ESSATLPEETEPFCGLEDIPGSPEDRSVLCRVTDIYYGVWTVLSCLYGLQEVCGQCSVLPVPRFRVCEVCGAFCPGSRLARSAGVEPCRAVAILGPSFRARPQLRPSYFCVFGFLAAWCVHYAFAMDNSYLVDEPLPPESPFSCMPSAEVPSTPEGAPECGPSSGPSSDRQLGAAIDLTDITAYPDDDDMSVCSHLSQVSSASRKQHKKRKAANRLSDGDSDGDARARPCDEHTSSVDICARISEYATMIDDIRKKSGKMQGKLSGDMKSLLKQIKDATFISTTRDSPEEVEQLRRSATSMQRKVAALRESNAGLRRAYDEAMAKASIPPPMPVAPPVKPQLRVVANEPGPRVTIVRPDTLARARDGVCPANGRPARVEQATPPIDVQTVTDTVIQTIMAALRQQGVLGSRNRSASRSASRRCRQASRSVSRGRYCDSSDVDPSARYATDPYYAYDDPAS
ncbi:hypothetical protein DMN91_013031, partial [Ooceraea biroi]